MRLVSSFVITALCVGCSPEQERSPERTSAPALGDLCAQACSRIEACGYPNPFGGTDCAGACQSTYDRYGRDFGATCGAAWRGYVGCAGALSCAELASPEQACSAATDAVAESCRETQDTSSGAFELIVTSARYTHTLGAYDPAADAIFLVVGQMVANTAEAVPLPVSASHFDVVTDAGISISSEWRASSAVAQPCNSTWAVAEGGELGCEVVFELLLDQTPERLTYRDGERSASSLLPPVEPARVWSCPVEYYGDGACDCGCGDTDADCGSESSCFEPGCSASGCEYCFDANGTTAPCGGNTTDPQCTESLSCMVTGLVQGLTLECRGGQCTEVGSVHDPCTTDADCASDLGGLACSLAGTCLRNTDELCGSAEECLSGSCSPQNGHRCWDGSSSPFGLCQVSADCDPGESCVTVTENRCAG